MKRRISRAICLVLFFVMLATSIGTATAMAYNQSYAPPVSNSDKTLYADELMSDLLGIKISEAEKNYLRAYADFSITTPQTIPQSNLTIDYDVETNTLTVFAADYSYLTEEGIEVVWKPIRATLRDEEKIVTSNEVSFVGEDMTGDNRVTVIYGATFEIPKEEVNRIINLAFKDARRLTTEIPEKKAESEKLREEYFKNKELYEEYLATLSDYQADLAVYKKYLSDKRVYDEKYEEYENYLFDLAEYEAGCLAREKYDSDLEKYYAEYAKYLDYVIYADKYQAKIEAYEAYLEKHNTVLTQLAVLDALKTPVTSLQRTVYSAIMGDTVTSVIENKDAIANEMVGASSDAVDLAGEATENLRILFADYFALETESDKYAYYTLNYENLRDSFTNLLKALDKLYTRRVRGILISQEKDEKYVILLAQLYCVVNALSDGPVLNYDKTACFDSEYKIGVEEAEMRSPLEILGSIYIPDTEKAAPLAEGYPQPVEKTEYTTMTEPIKPTFVPIPTLPTPVEEPTPIPEVAEPTPPKEVSHPGEEPAIYEPPAEYLALISDKDNIPPRAERLNSITYTPEISVSRNRFVEEEVTVTYYGKEYGEDVGEPIYTVTVEKGSYADFLGKKPIKDEDWDATYTFSHFVDKDGNRVDLSAVTEDLFLYPAFTPNYKQYVTKWVVGDSVLYEDPGTPTLPASGNMYYHFLEWDYHKDFHSGDVTYTAKFTKKYILPLHEGVGADVSFDGSRYTVDTKGATDFVDISVLLSLISGEGALTLKTAVGEIAFSYSSVMEMSSLGVEKIKLSAMRRTDGGYSYTLSLLNGDKTEITEQISANISVLCDISSRDGFVIYYVSSNARMRTAEIKNYVKYTANDGSVTFNALSNTEYHAALECTIGKIPSELAELSVDKAYAAPGEYVTVKYSVPLGIHVVGTYYVLRSGERVYFEDGFEMPEQSISFGIDCYREEYVVKFVSDGKIIASYTCYYGDTVTPPPDPKKASTQRYSYSFIGWSDTDFVITESKTINAQYLSTLLPEKVNTGIQMTKPVLRIFTLAITLGALALFVVIPSGIFMIIVVVSRKKKRIRVKKTEKNTPEK